ncbi:MAG: glycosyltransferase [Desulfovibrio sp.]|nr:glycosyltransferase [Desulfovibrio sp.]
MVHKLLFCMEDLCFGGTQRQTLELVRRLDRSRFAPQLLVFTGPTDLDAIPKSLDVPVTYLGRSRKVYPLFILSMARAIRQIAPDLLIPVTALPNIWARIWGRLLGIPVIGTCRGGGGPKRQHERYLWRLAARIICNSQALYDHLLSLGVSAQRLHYIPNGVDCDFFSPQLPPPSEREPVLLCVARLAEDKDHLTLLRAFELVLRAFPQARLRLVGDGPRQKELLAWVKARPHLAVDFVPGTTDVRPNYAEARLFVLSSEREGQPNVLLEAMSSGLPVCATAVGGIPALVDDGRTGLLSEAHNAEAFAANCLRLLNDPALGDAMGKQGRAAVMASYGFASMVRAHEEVFSEVLAEYGKA